MRKIFAAVVWCAALAAARAEPAAAVRLVRQAWPWERTVIVEFDVTGTDGARAWDVALTLPGGAAVPDAAVSGWKRGISRDGFYRVTVDPAKVPALAAAGRTEAFTVAAALTPSEMPAVVADMNEAVYLEVDLVTGARRGITRGEIMSGALGAFTVDPSAWLTVANLPAAQRADRLYWTAPATDAAYADYKKTKMLFRRIAAKGMVFPEYVTNKDTGGGVWRDVTLTRDYYAGVFEVTVAQWNTVKGSGDATDMKPKTSLKWEDIRGANTLDSESNSTPEASEVATDSFLGILRARTGLAFDLPTEAQWYLAASGGGRCAYYDGNPDTSDSHTGSIIHFGSQQVEVGSKNPNAWGLYNVQGGVGEFVLDWRTPADAGTAGTDNAYMAAGFAIDPRGMTAAQVKYNAFSGLTWDKRQWMLCGGASGQGRNRAKFTERDGCNPNTPHANYGFRVFLTVE